MSRSERAPSGALAAWTFTGAALAAVVAALLLALGGSSTGLRVGIFLGLLAALLVWFGGRERVSVAHREEREVVRAELVALREHVERMDRGLGNVVGREIQQVRDDVARLGLAQSAAFTRHEELIAAVRPPAEPVRAPSFLDRPTVEPTPPARPPVAAVQPPRPALPSAPAAGGPTTQSGGHRTPEPDPFALNGWSPGAPAAEPVVDLRETGARQVDLSDVDPEDFGFSYDWLPDIEHLPDPSPRGRHYKR